jgi:hypothetical protein
MRWRKKRREGIAWRAWNLNDDPGVSFPSLEKKSEVDLECFV